MGKSLLVFAFGLLLISSTTFAADETTQIKEHLKPHSPWLGDDSWAMRQFVAWDAHHNLPNYTHKITDKLDIPHIEFPIGRTELPVIPNFSEWLFGADRPEILHSVTLDFSAQMPEEFQELFRFEKDGETWVRWPLSPYDTKFTKIFMEYLEERGLPFEKHEDFFSGRTTSSRSMIITNPKTGNSISFKTSTNATAQGTQSFEYRPYPIFWAHLNRAISDYYYANRRKFENLDIAWEAGMIGLPPITTKTGSIVDTAVTFRLMESVSKGDALQMSAFVLADDNEVEFLAKKNNMTAQEFREKASYYFGRALTELNLLAGFVFDSAHSQNVRIELDPEYKLTGKVIFLDLTDGAPVGPIFRQNGAFDFIEQWNLNSAKATTNTVQEDGELRQKARTWFQAFDVNATQRGQQDRLRELTHYTEKEIMAFTKQTTGHLIIPKTSEAEFLAMLKTPSCKSNLSL